LNHLHFGNGPQKLYYQSLLRSFAKSAKAITSVSEFSAKEIADWLKIPQAKIQLTPNAIDPADLELSDFEQVQAESYLDQLQLKKGRFFIALSNPKPHKNLELLVRAYGQYRDSSAQPWPLVLSVPPGRSGIQGPGIFCLGSLTDTQAKIVLQSSGGVVFPSLYEGFGIPPLEAAVLGIPLAVSDIPSHREGLVDLSSEEVLWCSPLSEEPWRRAFHQLAEGVIPGANSETRNLVLKRWSVQNLALNMDRVYREALGLPPRNLRDLDKPTHPSLRAENLSLGT
jgi:glycosyltransferase involved in cell wall biosynthesis